MKIVSGFGNDQYVQSSIEKLYTQLAINYFSFSFFVSSLPSCTVKFESCVTLSTNSNDQQKRIFISKVNEPSEN
jgi:hypothetical protein